jgi:hypothetical protein
MFVDALQRAKELIRRAVVYGEDQEQSKPSSAVVKIRGRGAKFSRPQHLADHIGDTLRSLVVVKANRSFMYASTLSSLSGGTPQASIASIFPPPARTPATGSAPLARRTRIRDRELGFQQRLAVGKRFPCRSSKC